MRCIDVIKKVCSANYTDIISGNINFDHKPIPVSMSLHFVVSKVVQYIKGELAERCKGNFENIDTLYEGVPARISSKYAGG